jgi:hypothetical protein
VVTAETVAVKLALFSLASTVTEAGSVTDVSLLERLTVNPPMGAAELRVTVQESVPAPSIDELVQVSELSAATGLRLRTKV